MFSNSYRDNEESVRTQYHHFNNDNNNAGNSNNNIDSNLNKKSHNYVEQESSFKKNTNNFNDPNHNNNNNYFNDNNNNAYSNGGGSQMSRGRQEQHNLDSSNNSHHNKKNALKEAKHFFSYAKRTKKFVCQCISIIVLFVFIVICFAFSIASLTTPFASQSLVVPPPYFAQKANNFGGTLDEKLNLLYDGVMSALVSPTGLDSTFGKAESSYKNIKLVDYYLTDVAVKEGSSTARATEQQMKKYGYQKLSLLFFSPRNTLPSNGGAVNQSLVRAAHAFAILGLIFVIVTFLLTLSFAIVLCCHQSKRRKDDNKRRLTALQFESNDNDNHNNQDSRMNSINNNNNNNNNSQNRRGREFTDLDAVPREYSYNNKDNNKNNYDSNYNSYFNKNNANANQEGLPYDNRVDRGATSEDEYLDHFQSNRQYYQNGEVKRVEESLALREIKRQSVNKSLGLAIFIFLILTSFFFLVAFACEASFTNKNLKYDDMEENGESVSLRAGFAFLVVNFILLLLLAVFWASHSNNHNGNNTWYSPLFIFKYFNIARYCCACCSCCSCCAKHSTQGSTYRDSTSNKSASLKYAETLLFFYKMEGNANYTGPNNTNNMFSISTTEEGAELSRYNNVGSSTSMGNRNTNNNPTTLRATREGFPGSHGLDDVDKNNKSNDMFNIETPQKTKPNSNNNSNMDNNNKSNDMFNISTPQKESNNQSNTSNPNNHNNDLFNIEVPRKEQQQNNNNNNNNNNANNDPHPSNTSSPVFDNLPSSHNRNSNNNNNNNNNNNSNANVAYGVPIALPGPPISDLESYIRSNNRNTEGRLTAEYTEAEYLAQQQQDTDHHNHSSSSAPNSRPGPAPSAPPVPDTVSVGEGEGPHVAGAGAALPPPRYPQSAFVDPNSYLGTTAASSQPTTANDTNTNTDNNNNNATHVAEEEVSAGHNSNGDFPVTVANNKNSLIDDN